MTTRRDFLKGTVAATGIAFCSCAMLDAARAAGRRATIAGKRERQTGQDHRRARALPFPRGGKADGGRQCRLQVAGQRCPTSIHHARRQLYFDALVFTPEALRHLAAQVGASQIMLGSIPTRGSSTPSTPSWRRAPSPMRRSWRSSAATQRASAGWELRRPGHAGRHFSEANLGARGRSPDDKRPEGAAGSRTIGGTLLRFPWLASAAPSDVSAIFRAYSPGLINTEGTNAVGAQLGISYRPAFLSHPVRTKVGVVAYEMIVLLALADILRRRLAPFRVLVRIGWDQSCLNGGGRQSYQPYQRWNDHSHLSLFLGGITRQCAG